MNDSGRILSLMPAEGHSVILEGPYEVPLLAWALVEYPDGERLIEGVVLTDAGPEPMGSVKGFLRYAT